MDLAQRISNGAVAALDLVPLDERFDELSRRVLQGGATRFAAVVNPAEDIDYVIPVGVPQATVNFGALVVQASRVGLLWREGADERHLLVALDEDTSATWTPAVLGGEVWTRFDLDDHHTRLSVLTPPTGSSLLRDTLIQRFHATDAAPPDAEHTSVMPIIDAGRGASDADAAGRGAIEASVSGPEEGAHPDAAGAAGLGAAGLGAAGLLGATGLGSDAVGAASTVAGRAARPDGTLIGDGWDQDADETLILDLHAGADEITETDAAAVPAVDSEAEANQDATQPLDAELTQALELDATQALELDATQALELDATQALDGEATLLRPQDPDIAEQGGRGEHATPGVGGDAAPALRGDETQALDEDAAPELDQEPTVLWIPDQDEPAVAPGGDPEPQPHADATQALDAGATQAFNPDATQALDAEATELWALDHDAESSSATREPGEQETLTTMPDLTPATPEPAEQEPTITPPVRQPLGSEAPTAVLPSPIPGVEATTPIPAPSPRPQLGPFPFQEPRNVPQWEQSRGEPLYRDAPRETGSLPPVSGAPASGPTGAGALGSAGASTYGAVTSGGSPTAAQGSPSARDWGVPSQPVSPWPSATPQATPAWTGNAPTQPIWSSGTPVPAAAQAHPAPAQQGGSQTLTGFLIGLIITLFVGGLALVALLLLG